MYEACDAGPFFLQKVIKSVYTALPVGTLQVIAAVHQEERGIQVSLDLMPADVCVPLGEPLPHIVIRYVVIL